MTRDLPDELLSAYLDGEVSAQERAAVEAHLANSDADRQLLAELRSLRRDMAMLPAASVSPDFAQRVVQAAVAAKAAVSPATTVSRSNKRSRGTWLWTTAAAGATAAGLLLALTFWRPDPNPVAGGPTTNANPLVAALHSALPAEGQAVVLRLRLPKDMQVERALAAALATAGVGSKAADANTGAGELGAAYRSQLAQQFGADADATVSAAEAIFVEAPLANLEKLLTELAAAASQPCELRPEASLAFAGPRQGSDNDTAVGEAAAQNVPGAAAGQPYVQHLPASLFRLPKEAVPVASSPAAAGISSDKVVRVLILIEQIEAR
jgi:anti-sigma factor RsiW